MDSDNPLYLTQIHDLRPPQQASRPPCRPLLRKGTSEQASAGRKPDEIVVVASHSCGSKFKSTGEHRMLWRCCNEVVADGAMEP
jgi:hypothetical protein